MDISVHEAKDIQRPALVPSDVFATLRTSATMGAITDPRWLVKGIIEQNKISCVFGPSGSFKSFAMLDMGLSIASGQDFHGMQTETGSVLYVCGEGLEGINKRIKAWELEKNAGQSVENFFVTPRPVALNTSEGREMINAMVDGIKEATGEYPVQIIVDTLDRNFSGDENSSAAMSSFVDALTEIRVKTEASVAVVHHTSKSNPDEARGSNVLRSGMDTEIRIKRDDKDNIHFENTKMKDEKDGGAVVFRYKVVKVGYSNKYQEEITSVVLIKNEKAEKANKAVEKIDNNTSVGQVNYSGLGKIQKSVLESLLLAVGKDGTIGTEEYYLIAKSEGKTRKAVREALAGLQSKAIVHNDTNTIKVSLPGFM